MGITIIEKGQVTERLSDIFIDQSVTDEINDIINYFKQSNDCFQNNTLVSTRLILYGNQNGIGKTAIASSIAGELGFKLVKINAQTVSEENLAKETEEQAELLETDGPSVIFINNIEFLKNDSLNLILTVLENIEANTKKVILILGTNNTEKVSNEG
jgi:replication-associated recombination protein RarA